MRAVWQYLLPYCAKNFCSFENRIDAVIEEISVTGKDPALKMLIHPLSENAWILIHSHSLTRIL
jgi:hypothetical protein